MKALKAIPQGDFNKTMEGIMCDTNKKVKDEAPQAYKDLKSVMENQDHHVKVVHQLQVLVNVKSFGL